MSAVMITCLALALVWSEFSASADNQAVVYLADYDGHPVLEYHGRHYHFNWTGVPQAITQTPPDTAPSLAVSQFTTEPAQFGVEIQQRLASALGAVPDCACLGPAPPHGSRQAAGGTAGWPPQAVVIDAATGEVLARFDLAQVFSINNPEPRDELRLAQLRSAAIGPQGLLGVEFYFSSADAILILNGTWDGQSWSEKYRNWSGRDLPPATLLVGPADSLIRVTPEGTVFFTGQNQLSLHAGIGAFWAGEPPLARFRARLLQRVLACQALLGAVCLVAVAGIATLWPLLPGSQIALIRLRRG